MLKKSVVMVSLLLFLVSSANATIVTTMRLTMSGRVIGTIDANDTVYGLLLTPHLRNLSPGLHGFHIHQIGTCSCEGKAAGGHFDPELNRQHRGPYQGDGHIGDLPVLSVHSNGTATLPVLAPRLKLADLGGHALMIDVESDNYADVPRRNGGGSVHMACGVMPYY